MSTFLSLCQVYPGATKLRPAVPGRGWLWTVANRITQSSLIQLIIHLFGEMNSPYLPLYRCVSLSFLMLGELEMQVHQLQHAPVRRDCSHLIWTIWNKLPHSDFTEILLTYQKIHLVLWVILIILLTISTKVPVQCFSVWDFLALLFAVSLWGLCSPHGAKWTGKQKSMII